MEWAFAEGLLFGGIGGLLIGVAMTVFMMFPRDRDY